MLTLSLSQTSTKGLSNKRAAAVSLFVTALPQLAHVLSQNAAKDDRPKGSKRARGTSTTPVEGQSLHYSMICPFL